MKKIHALMLLLAMISIGLITNCIPDLADIEPPVVTIIHPAEGTVVNGTVQVLITASDDEEIDELRVYIDGRNVATTGENFISYSWVTDSIADNLQHYISAVAIDNSDNIGSSETVTVTVTPGQNEDNIAPVVSILNPVEGQIVTGDVNIVAEASDNNVVDRVEFYIDGYLEETVSNPPYDYLWETTQADTGDHTIFVRAYDTNNNKGVSATITVTVDTTLDNTPPVVNIVNPISGQIVSGTVNILADATDNNGVERVELYIDGLLETTISSPPYEYLWDSNQVSEGDHNIFARAYDFSNNSAISPTITVTVDTTADETPPTVAIVNPLTGQEVSGMVNIAAEATDNVGVDRVEFYIDGLLETTVSSPPFDYLWDTAPLDTGDYNIFARAYDLSNNSSVSTTITVTVVPTTLRKITGPKVKIISPPTHKQIFSEANRQTIPIEVEVQHDSKIEKVEFYIDGNLEKVVTARTNNHFRYEWNVDGFGDGSLHAIFVKAIDNASKSGADMKSVRIYP